MNNKYYQNYYKTHKKEKDKRQWKYYNSHIKKYLLRLAKKRAKRKGLEFNITENDFDLPIYCPVLGLKLAANFGKGSGGKDNSYCLDRFDNTKGYIKGNVVIMSQKANRLKGDSVIEDIEKLLEWYKTKLAEKQFGE